MSEDGSLAVFADSDGTIELDEPGSSEPRWTRENPDGVVRRGRFSANGKQIAMAFRSGIVRVFSTGSARSLARLEGSQAVVALDFDKSGELLVGLTGPSDGTESYSGYGGERLLLWSVPEETLLATLVPVYEREYPLVLAPTGEVDPGPGGSGHLGCRAGIHVLPFALCEERFVVPGLLSRALTGDVGYRDP